MGSSLHVRSITFSYKINYKFKHGSQALLGKDYMIMIKKFKLRKNEHIYWRIILSQLDWCSVYLSWNHKKKKLYVESREPFILA